MLPRIWVVVLSVVSFTAVVARAADTPAERPGMAYVPAGEFMMGSDEKPTSSKVTYALQPGWAPKTPAATLRRSNDCRSSLAVAARRS